MKRDKTVSFEFVETVPAHLKEETIYVSIRYATAVHKCFCGCGNEVVTPLSPTDWAVTFDGESVSLDPSVGSWNLPCRSHYWIDRNRVKWAPRWSRERIRIGRAADSFAKATYYNEQAIRNVAGNPELIRKKVPTPRERVWSAITRWWRKNDSDHR